MRTLEVLLSFDRFNHKKFANIFVEQDSSINNWHEYEKETDIINVKDKQDLFMSYFDDSYFLKPFDFNTNHDPFFRWSIVRLDVPDWKWHLNHI